jgi:hypothetical protein
MGPPEPTGTGASVDRVVAVATELGPGMASLFMFIPVQWVHVLVEDTRRAYRRLVWVRYEEGAARRARMVNGAASASWRFYRKKLVLPASCAVKGFSDMS